MYIVTFWNEDGTTTERIFAFSSTAIDEATIFADTYNEPAMVVDCETGEVIYDA